jgi:hypothetical protein
MILHGRALASTLMSERLDEREHGFWDLKMLFVKSAGAKIGR